MADGVHAAIDRMKPTALDSRLDRPPARSTLNDLPPSYEPVLSLGFIGKPPIQPHAAIQPTTSDAFYIYGLYNASLVGHATDGPP
jgi:hypothetical protein